MSALDLVVRDHAPDDGPVDTAALVQALAVEVHARFDSTERDIGELTEQLRPVVDLVEQLAPIVEALGPIAAQLGEGANPMQLLGMLMGR